MSRTTPNFCAPSSPVTWVNGSVDELLPGADELLPGADGGAAGVLAVLDMRVPQSFCTTYTLPYHPR